MDDLTFAAIRRRLQTKITDLGETSYSKLNPADPVAMADDERRLGFMLPPFMKRIYTDSGNGGFGPGTD